MPEMDRHRSSAMTGNRVIRVRFASSRDRTKACLGRHEIHPYEAVFLWGTILARELARSFIAARSVMLGPRTVRVGSMVFTAMTMFLTGAGRRHRRRTIEMRIRRVRMMPTTTAHHVYGQCQHTPHVHNPLHDLFRAIARVTVGYDLPRAVPDTACTQYLLENHSTVGSVRLPPATMGFRSLRPFRKPSTIQTPSEEQMAPGTTGLRARQESPVVRNCVTASEPVTTLVVIGQLGLSGKIGSPTLWRSFDSTDSSVLEQARPGFGSTANR